MTHRIVDVKPLEDFVVLATFQNGIKKEYDMKRLFSVLPQFKEFVMEDKLFEQVRVDIGGYGIVWNDNLDLGAEEIWDEGELIYEYEELDTVSLLANSLMLARDSSKMTQKQLAEETGIYQADISKIERGLANPSLSTLQRLADGLGKKLVIEFASKDKK